MNQHVYTHTLDRETGPPFQQASESQTLKNVALWTMTLVVGMAEMGSLAATRELKRRMKEGNQEAARAYRRLFPKDNDNANARLCSVRFA